MRKQLALIGKRAIDNNGKPLFSKVTVSTAEEAALQDFLMAAKQNLASALIRRISFTGNLVNVYGTNVIVLSNAVHEYLIAEIVSKYMSAYYPQQAMPYAQVAVEALSSVVNIAYTRAEPEGSNDHTEEISLTET